MRSSTGLQRLSLIFILIIASGMLVFWSLKHVARQPNLNLHSLTFDVSPADPVAMIIHNTHRYDLTSRGIEDYAALLPPGGHLVHLGSPPEVYTPTLFHQMKCLGIIHAALVEAPPGFAATPTPLVSHCLNYLRQTILCRPNLRLESVIDANASSEKEYETVCLNWEVVYDAAKQNHAAFSIIQEEAYSMDKNLKIVIRNY